VAVEVVVLGGVVALRNGRAVDLGGPTLTRVLAALAADAPAAVPLRRLADHVWAGAPPATAEKALRVHVGRLRRVLGEAIVLTTPGGYRLGDPEALDILRYEAAVDGAERAGEGDRHAALARLEEALRLWRGAPFGDLGDEPWLAPRVAGLCERHRLDEERHSELVLDLGPVAGHLHRFRRRAADEPLRERRWAQLISALHRTGHDAEAARAYAECRNVLADTLGLTPGPIVQRAYDDAIVRGRHAPTANPDGPLVGRAAELTAVEQRLAEHAVVTVLGIGGIGKTRLAEAVVDRQRARGGLACVLRVPTSGEDGRLAEALAAQVGGPVVDAEDALDALVTRLVGVDLLVVDGAERSLTAIAELLDRIRARRPRLRVLATSREPLGLTGETHLTLGPLPLPADGAGWAGTAAELLARRRGVTPELADPAARREVLDDTRRSAGVPLLVELAARNGVTGAGRPADDRGVTDSVQALVAGLDDAGRRPAHALAVLPGGMSQALGRAIGVADRGLRQLAWLGLAVTELRGDTVRYDMLDPVRAAVAGTVPEADRQAAEAGARAHLLATGRAVRAAADRPPAYDKLDDAEAELPTFRWMLTVTAAADGLDLTEAMADVLGLRGLTGEGLAALAGARADADPVVAARAAVAAARIGRFGTTLGALAEDLARALETFRAAGAADLATTAALYAVVANLQRGDIPKARALVAATETTAPGEWLAGQVDIALGFVTAMEGAPLDGIELLQRAEARLRPLDLGAAAFAAYVTGAVGGFVLAPDARDDLLRAREGAQEVTDGPLAALCAYAEVDLRRRRGEAASAEELRLLAADCERAGLRDRGAQAHLLAGRALLDTGALPAARAELLVAATTLVRARHQLAPAAVAGLAAAIEAEDDHLARALGAAARALPPRPGFPLGPDDHDLAQHLLALAPAGAAATRTAPEDVLDLVDRAADLCVEV
jgi:DNA-binding SARP family transcriptional activator/predicted ATPase